MDYSNINDWVEAIARSVERDEEQHRVYDRDPVVDADFDEYDL